MVVHDIAVKIISTHQAIFYYQNPLSERVFLLILTTSVMLAVPYCIVRKPCYYKKHNPTQMLALSEAEGKYTAEQEYRTDCVQN